LHLIEDARFWDDLHSKSKLYLLILKRSKFQKRMDLQFFGTKEDSDGNTIFANCSRRILCAVVYELTNVKQQRVKC